MANSLYIAVLHLLLPWRFTVFACLAHNLEFNNAHCSSRHSLPLVLPSLCIDHTESRWFSIRRFRLQFVPQMGFFCLVNHSRSALSTEYVSAVLIQEAENSGLNLGINQLRASSLPSHWLLILCLSNDAFTCLHFVEFSLCALSLHPYSRLVWSWR